MPSKSRIKQKKSIENFHLIKSYEECLRKGIPTGKIYESDFTNGSINTRYTIPPYPWNLNLFSSNSKRKDSHHARKKSTGTVQKKIKVKSKSATRSKSKAKQQQKRSKSRRR